MVAANNAIYNTVGASISGVTNTLTITNPSNTASSAARETIVVGGGTAGDPTLNWNVSGVTNWEMGIDNSVTDNLTISQGTALGTNDVWRMTVAGERTMPLQPAFYGFLNTTVANQVGNSLVPVTVVFDSEVFDQNADFSVATGIFTAPVTGRYWLSSCVRVLSVTAAMAESNIRIVASNGVIVSNDLNAGVVRVFEVLLADYLLGFQICGLMDMDAADTAQVQILMTSGAGATAGFYGPGSRSGAPYFMGYLAC